MKKQECDKANKNIKPNNNEMQERGKSARTFYSSFAAFETISFRIYLRLKTKRTTFLCVSVKARQ